MKVFTNITAVIRPEVVVMLLLIQATLWAQDLETTWRDYLSIDATLTAAVESERELVEQQHKLSEAIRNLQESQSWYNGWIIELMLARKSTLQVELADSLQQIRKKIADLEMQRNEAFLALRNVYQQVLLETKPENILSRAQKENVLAIGRQLLDQGSTIFDLPDYTSIINSPYENDAIKHLILEDLQAVLRAKLVLIDSLLTEKDAELALLSRLNEFHRDLSYQMKSDLDPGTGSADETAAGSGASDMDITTYNEPTWGEGDRSVKLAEESIPDLAPLTDQNRIVSGETSVQLNINPIGEVIDRLKYKRQQYQDFLRQIETELPH